MPFQRPVGVLCVEGVEDADRAVRVHLAVVGVFKLAAQGVVEGQDDGRHARRDSLSCLERSRAG